jgi:uncharacterized protein (TIGR03435 family)
MFQTLLRERFHFAYHIEKQKTSVLNLVKVGDGPRLRPSSDDDSPPNRSGSEAGGTLGSLRHSGVPLLSRGNTAYSYGISGTRWEGNDVPLSELIPALSRRLERKVTDHTGLTGKFEYSLEFKDDLAPSTGVASVKDTPLPAGMETDAPNFAIALKEQLGLKLVPAEEMLEVLIVDHIDKVPTLN